MKRLSQPGRQRTAIYARVSSQKQKDGETIESQLEALRKWASQQGQDIPEALVFSDDGVSGSSLQRPALDELRDIIRVEPIGTLLVYSPDRLARNYTHQLILLDEFRKHGVRVSFLKAPQEADTPEGKMLAHMQGIFAEYERALILDRSRRGRIHKAKQNNPVILPSVPFGYERRKEGSQSVVVVVEDKAAIVREIFRLYAREGLSLRNVARRINEQGIKTPKGGIGWHDSTLRGILRNQAYIGTSHYGKTERSEGVPDLIRHYKGKPVYRAQHARKRKPETEWLPIDMPQIICESDFELAQEKLTKNAVYAKRNTKQPGLLQGLVICGECGMPYQKRTRRGKQWGTYYCSSRRKKSEKPCSNASVKQPRLDQLVYDEILKLLQNPTLVQEELSRRAQQLGDKEEAVRQETLLKKELNKLTQERDRLLDAYQSGLLDLNALKTRSKSLDTRRMELERQLDGLNALKMQREGHTEIERCFSEILNGMEEAAQSLPFDKKRKLIRLLVEKVVIRQNDISIVHCISPRMIRKENGALRAVAPG